MRVLAYVFGDSEFLRGMIWTWVLRANNHVRVFLRSINGSWLQLYGVFFDNGASFDSMAAAFDSMAWECDKACV